MVRSAASASSTLALHPTLAIRDLPRAPPRSPRRLPWLLRRRKACLHPRHLRWEPVLNDNLESHQIMSQDHIKPYTPPSGRKLNMLEIGIPYSKDKEEQIKNETKIVLAHGYGAGSAFFFQNIKSMAEVPNSRLYVVDWLGMGRSSRPTFHIPSSETKSTDTRVCGRRELFHQQPRRLATQDGPRKDGACRPQPGRLPVVSVCAALPSRVERLVLVSPVGIPNAPPEDEPGSTFRPKNGSAVEQEVRQPQETWRRRTRGKSSRIRRRPTRWPRRRRRTAPAA